MDIHKPKAAHSIREFLIEIGTIICGILIALGLEQTIEFVHWRTEVAETREALREEIATNAAVAVIRAEEGRCMPTRLDEMLKWANGGPAYDLEAGRNAAFGGPHYTVWDVAKSGQAMSRMPLNERLAYADFYGIVLTQQTNVLIERNLVVRLVRNLVHASLTREEARRFAEDIEEARTWFRVGRNLNLGMIARAKKLGIDPQPLEPGARARLARFCATTKPQ